MPDYPSYPGYPGGTGMMDPATMQALMAASSGQEDQANLQQQMRMAQALRQQMPNSDDMAGRVVVRHNPMEYIGATMGNIMAQRQQNDTLKQMKENADALRKARGAIQQGLLKQMQPQQPMMPAQQPQPQPHMNAPMEGMF